MRSRHVIVLAQLFICVVALFRPAAVQAHPAKRIYAGVYLHDVSKFDQKDGVFDVDLDLWAKWLGEFDSSKLAIANAAEIEREVLGEEKDGEWHSTRWRVKGTLRGEFPLQSFPFDKQTLSVVLELQERDGELAPDLAGSGMRERFSVTGWLYTRRSWKCGPVSASPLSWHALRFTSRWPTRCRTSHTSRSRTCFSSFRTRSRRRYSSNPSLPTGSTGRRAN